MNHRHLQRTEAGISDPRDGVEGFEPGRRIGIIAKTRSRDEHGKMFVFIHDVENNEYFAHRSAFNDEAVFTHGQEGDGVNFRVARTGKGKRAFDINRASEEEMIVLRAGEEQRGNR